LFERLTVLGEEKQLPQRAGVSSYAFHCGSQCRIALSLLEEVSQRDIVVSTELLQV